jgi:Ni/Co efflux regulator RcnB
LGIEKNPRVGVFALKSKRFASIGATLLFVMSAASAQDRRDQRDQRHTQLDDRDRQTTTDWYNQHKDHPPVGLRSQDWLSPDEESRLREGAVLDKDLRKRVHPVPKDLESRLPPPASDHRYVAIGGHIGLIDNNFQVKGVIHLH